MVRPGPNKARNGGEWSTITIFHVYKGPTLQKVLQSPMSWLLLRQICLLVCELTIKGGWAGVNIAPASKVPERARRAPDARRGYGG